MNKENFSQIMNTVLKTEFAKTPETASVRQLHFAISKAVLCAVQDAWQKQENYEGKQVCYLSAEFLIGRSIYQNLLNLELGEMVNDLLQPLGYDFSCFEEIEDPALGNGGLGRLAACFLDSGATLRYRLNGYGIRYQQGLFKQHFEDGFQKEEGDNWLHSPDPWSIRREEDAVLVHFAEETVRAVPYDMPVIGYKSDCINTLRLWQSEAVQDFDFDLFNAQNYDESLQNRNDASYICMSIYPNDDGTEGKRLRLKQQYFMCSATMQDILRQYKAKHSGDFSEFGKFYAVQLNDTHPTLAIPEFIRLLQTQERLPFETALSIARETFAYTNHTLMAEALETWDFTLVKNTIPVVAQVIEEIHAFMLKELSPQNTLRILLNDTVHMANLAVYCSFAVNGVAKIHSELLRTEQMKDWYAVYPDRFQNKTNGITPRRWIGVANPELSKLITNLLGSDSWLKNLERLHELEKYADDEEILTEFMQIKSVKKAQLAGILLDRENCLVDPTSMFDIQVKRLHEYKRQLMNAFCILAIYYRLKAGKLPNFHPMTCIFGAKAAPGYRHAKGIIKYINEIAALINSDPAVNGLLKVVFVQNYNVSYAEKLIPAADISEQISTAGTEASGTGNMKFMLNGAVTLGTYDGANIEIVERAGWENNYIFGYHVEDLEKLKPSYQSKKCYEENKELKFVVDTLIDGTFDDGGTGLFKELYDSLLKGASWHIPDHYFIFADFSKYLDTRLAANADYEQPLLFARKCWLNMTSSGYFSSDRTIKEYAAQIWNL